MIFYGIWHAGNIKSESFRFMIQLKNERLTEILQAVRCHILWSYYYHNQFIKPFLDKKKMSIFEEYGAF